MLFTRELSFDPEMTLPLPTYPVLGKGQINSWSVATVGKHHVGMRIKATRSRRLEFRFTVTSSDCRVKKGWFYEFLFTLG